MTLAPADPATVNSRAYWDGRFNHDWQARGGPGQSRFFANILLTWLPPRVRAEIAAERLSICDWGCAEGDGTALIAAAFPDSAVTGVDLSEVGIRNAAARYPGIDFRVGDVDAVAGGYDVIITSNVLEHLDDPWRAAATLAGAASRYLLVLVPFLDTSKDPEHRYVFGPFDLCEQLAEDVHLADARAIDTGAMPLSQWAGQQLLAVYRRSGPSGDVAAAEMAALQKLQLAVEHEGHVVGAAWPASWHTVSGARLVKAYVQLREAHAELRGRAAALAETLASLETELVATCAARDAALSRASDQAQLLTTLEERNAALEQQSAALEQQRDGLEQQRDGLEQRTAVLVENGRALAQQSGALEQQRAALEQRNAALARENATLAEKGEALAHQSAGLTLQNAQLADTAERAEELARWSEEADRLYARVAEMLTATLTSTSWRLTAPMRTTVRRVLSRGPEVAVPPPALPLRPRLPDPAPVDAPAVASVAVPAPALPLPLIPRADVRAAVSPVVAMLVQDFDVGGLEHFVLNLAKEFGRCGMPSTILVTGRSGRAAAAAERAGVPVRVCGGDPDAVVGVVQEFRIRLVLAHHCFLAWQRLAALGVPIFEVLQNLYHWHRGDGEHRELRRHVERFIAVSHDVRDFAVRFLGLDPARVLYIPNGIDTAGFLRPRASVLLQQRRQGEFVFLQVAQIWASKCHHSVLTAFARLHAELPQVRLVFAGAGSDAEVHARLLERVATMGLAGAVTLTGALDRRGLSQLYARANALLLPSLIEGFSLASLEGLYFGLPLIITDVGGAREIVEDEDVGLLIAPPLPPESLTPEHSHALGASDDAGHADALYTAMRRMVVERDIWIGKGLDGMVKFSRFDIKAVTASYEALLAPALAASSPADAGRGG